MRQRVTGEAAAGAAKGTDWLRKQPRASANPLAKLAALPAALMRADAALCQGTRMQELLACHAVPGPAGEIAASLQSHPADHEQPAEGNSGSHPAEPAREEQRVRLDLLWEWACPAVDGLNVACMAWNKVLMASLILQGRIWLHGAMHGPFPLPSLCPAPEPAAVFHGRAGCPAPPGGRLWPAPIRAAAGRCRMRVEQQEPRRPTVAAAHSRRRHHPRVVAPQRRPSRCGVPGRDPGCAQCQGPAGARMSHLHFLCYIKLVREVDKLGTCMHAHACL